MGSVTPRPKSSQVQPTGPASTVIQRTPRPGTPSDAIVSLSQPRPKIQSGDGDIQTRLNEEGVGDVKDIFRFFGKMLVPATTLVAVIFTMYAVLSWIVPNKLCHDDIMDLSGSTLGFGKCVYNNRGEYASAGVAQWFWLLFWAIQVAWVPVFPGVVTRAIFRSSMSRVQMLTVIVCAVACVTTVIVTGVKYNLPIMNQYVNLVMNLSSIISGLTCSTAAARHTGNRITRWRYFLLFAAGGQVTSLYYFVMPRLISLRSGDVMWGLGLTFIRLAIHPVVWGAVLLLFRNVMRHIGRVPDLAHTCFLVWPMLYSSLYGRFLLLQLDNVGSVVLIDFMMACFEITGMLVDRGKDQGWLKLLYGDRANYAMQALPAVDEYILVETLTTLTMEGTSIFAASALLSFGGVAVMPGSPPKHTTIWFNAAVQTTTLVLFTVVQPAANSKFHKVEWERVWPKSTRRFFFFSLLVLIIGSSRLCVELLLLFCPKHYEEHGILLEQCDKPSLFGAMKAVFDTFTFF